METPLTVVAPATTECAVDPLLAENILSPAYLTCMVLEPIELDVRAHGAETAHVADTLPSETVTLPPGLRVAPEATATS